LLKIRNKKKTKIEEVKVMSALFVLPFTPYQEPLLSKKFENKSSDRKFYKSVNFSSPSALNHCEFVAILE
jgi:hypothetical protein